MDVKKPGFETTEQLWSSNPKYLKKFVDKRVLPFLNIDSNTFCLDMGETNPRMEYLKKTLKLKVFNIESDDFNYDGLYGHQKADAVFAFEVIEHLQNPLWFMRELKELTNGSIYVIIPCNPRWLWHEKHFFEMDRKHFEKWILKPLDLKIVRYKRIFFTPSWKKYLIGFRPFLRLLTGKTSMKDMLRSLLCIQWGIYEIRKN